MDSTRIDKSIVQLRFSSNFLILSSLAIFTISIFLGSEFANRAEDDLLRITNIANYWPRATPRHFQTIVSDITIGSSHFSGNMGYVAFHSSSLFSSTYSANQLFLPNGNHNAAIIDANLYQERALPLLQQFYSSTPETLSEFRRAWDHLAFPMYFMQFSSVPNWYLGTIDESRFVSWKHVEKGYMPNVPPAVRPDRPIELSLSNKYSQWNIFGNVWRGDDSSPQMKADRNCSPLLIINRLS